MKKNDTRATRSIDCSKARSNASRSSRIWLYAAKFARLMICTSSSGKYANPWAQLFSPSACLPSTDPAKSGVIAPLM